MVFQLGKNKSADDENVRQETFQRWREASQRHQAGGSTQGAAGSGEPESAPQETQLELNVNVEPPPMPTTKNPNVEEIKMDSMRAVEWPDPRATISLTKEVPPDPLPLATVAPSAPQPPPVLERAKVTPIDQRSATAKLAQFVSSGLSATGLLGGNKPQPAKPSVEVIRNVADTPLEVERRPTVSLSPVSLSPVSLSPVPAPKDPNAALNDDIKRRFGANIRSALGPGTIIEGTFSFDTPVSIEGTLIGEVRSNSVLVVGAQATVNARVKVGSLIVFGTVRGDVESQGLVEIRDGGLLEGDVTSERFAMEDGGWFHGRCTPTGAPKASKAGVEAEQVLVGEEDSFGDSWSIE